MGTPIQILDGVNSNYTHLSGVVDGNIYTELQTNEKYHNDITDIMLAKELNSAVNGLGSTDDAMLNYLIKTKNIIISNPEAISRYQNPIQLAEMFQYAIDNWNTLNREEALSILAEKEADLIEDGNIAIDYLQGLDGADNDWYADDYYDNENEETERGLDYRYTEIEGINGNSESGREYRLNGLAGFFRSLKKWNEEESILDGLNGLDGRKERKAERKRKAAERKRKRQAALAKLKAKGKAALAKAKDVGGKVLDKVKKYNPLSVTIRNAFLLAMKINLFKLADKFAIGYMSASAARSKGVSPQDHKKAVALIAKLKKMHVNILGGKESCR